ncbi:hypothetical protein [Shewanella baltica]|uniref:hypothetical protein n=1 Tax=Shewanella baltica TaxID=62322 RepID=UPI00321852EC
MFESKLLNRAILLIPLMLLFTIYMIFIKMDNKFTQVLGEVNKKEVYQMIKLDGKSNPKGSIKFEKFYDCLQGYQPQWKRKIPKGHPSEDFYLEVLIPPKDLLFFDVRSNEAYQVLVRSMDENGVYQDSSGTHAINCSIDLIDFVDKSEVF